MLKAFGVSQGDDNLPVCLDFLSNVIDGFTFKCINSDSFKTQFAALIDPEYNCFTIDMCELVVARLQMKDPNGRKPTERGVQTIKAVDYLIDNLIKCLAEIGIEAIAKYEDLGGLHDYNCDEFPDPIIEGN